MESNECIIASSDPQLTSPFIQQNCLSNALFVTSAADDYIRPVFSDGDVILDIECGDNQGRLHLSLLNQGSRGACILFANQWLTPNEFQQISGRETAKDWKRSIRHCGKSMKLLFSKGILTTHSTACECDSCRTVSF